MSCRLFVTCEIHNNWRKWSLLEFEVPFFDYPSLNAESFRYQQYNWSITPK